MQAGGREVVAEFIGERAELGGGSGDGRGRVVRFRHKLVSLAAQAQH